MLPPTHSPPTPPASPTHPNNHHGHSTTKPPIHAALILTCTRPAHLVEKFGTVASDFTRMLAPHFDLLSLRVYDGCAGEVPAVEELDGIDLLLIPGSFHMVTDQAEWMVRLEEVVRRRRCWIFGVCFGMQLACKAYGGQVEWNPNGVEVGVAQVECDLPGCHKRTLTVLQSHDMHIATVPDGFKVVAWNRHTPVQAILSTEHRIMGVQFHPDFAVDYFHYTRECRKATQEQADLVLTARFDHDLVLETLKRLIGGGGGCKGEK